MPHQHVVPVQVGKGGIMMNKIYDREIPIHNEIFTVDLYMINSRRCLLVCRETNEIVTFNCADAWLAKNVLEWISHTPWMYSYREIVASLEKDTMVETLLDYVLTGMVQGNLPWYPLEECYCITMM